MKSELEDSHYFVECAARTWMQVFYALDRQRREFPQSFKRSRKEFLELAIPLKKEICKVLNLSEKTKWEIILRETGNLKGMSTKEVLKKWKKLEDSDACLSDKGMDLYEKMEDLRYNITGII